MAASGDTEMATTACDAEPEARVTVLCLQCIVLMKGMERDRDRDEVWLAKLRADTDSSRQYFPTDFSQYSSVLVGCVVTEQEIEETETEEEDDRHVSIQTFYSRQMYCVQRAPPPPERMNFDHGDYVEGTDKAIWSTWPRPTDAEHRACEIDYDTNHANEHRLARSTSVGSMPPRVVYPSEPTPSPITRRHSLGAVAVALAPRPCRWCHCRLPMADMHEETTWNDEEGGGRIYLGWTCHACWTRRNVCSRCHQTIDELREMMGCAPCACEE